MRRNDLIIAAVLALLAHAGMFLAPGLSTQAQVLLQSGKSALVLTLMPSQESAEARKAPKPERQIDPAEFLDKHTPKIKRAKKPEKVDDPIKPVKLQPELEIAQVVNRIPPIKVHAVRVEEEDPIDKRLTDVPNPTVQVEEVKPEPKPVATPAPHDSVASKETAADMRRKGVDKKAVATHLPKPQYPRCCRRRGREGVVVLKITILASGECGNIQVLQSGGCPRMDEAAIGAVRRAQFIPAHLLGHPVTSIKKLKFVFRLTDE
ncbi:MAG: TonB family protein [Planctomycetes bacterium]|nr:TonB family protein [Planctomycetota bacterium]